MRRVVLAFALAAALAGCNDKRSIEAGELRGLVLQPSDLSGQLVRFDEGRQVRADQPVGPRSDPARFGREEGWKARYRRPGTLATPGPLVVESRVDLFDGEDGASKELDAHEAELREGRGAVRLQLVEAPAIGDETLTATLLEQGALAGVRFYLVVWREGKVTASVFANGFEGRMSLADVVSLARKQERRIAAASG